MFLLEGRAPNPKKHPISNLINTKPTNSLEFKMRATTNQGNLINTKPTFLASEKQGRDNLINAKPTNLASEEASSDLDVINTVPGLLGNASNMQMDLITQLQPC